MPLYHAPLFFAGLFAVITNGLPHVRERLSADLLGGSHFISRAVAIALLVEQPARELRLQRDLRQGFAQHVVQLIGDALALGDLGEAAQVHAQPHDPDLPGDRERVVDRGVSPAHAVIRQEPMP